MKKLEWSSSSKDAKKLFFEKSAKGSAGKALNPAVRKDNKARVRGHSTKNHP